MHAIAIDGPAGAGKSTIAQKVAQKLGILYLDTGAMYRSLGYAALAADIDINDEAAVKAWLPTVDLEVRLGINGQENIIGGEDISDRIRTPEISQAASRISAIPAVRYYAVKKQRELAVAMPLVLDGRDIGSFVLPAADFKFYLTASIQVRGKRRLRQLQAKAMGEGVPFTLTLAEIMEDMELRDRNDSSRELAPLVKADDAMEIDTDNLDITGVEGEIIKSIVGKCQLDDKLEAFWHNYLTVCR